MGTGGAPPTSNIWRWDTENSLESTLGRQVCPRKAPARKSKSIPFSFNLPSLDCTITDIKRLGRGETIGLGLTDNLSKLLPWTKKEKAPPVGLNLVDQLALSFLLKFERGKVDDIYVDASATRPTSRAELLVSLTRMSEIGLIERLSPSGGPPGERIYGISKRGKKLRGIIPVEPKSAMDVWV